MILSVNPSLGQKLSKAYQTVLSVKPGFGQNIASPIVGKSAFQISIFPIH